MMKGFSHQTTVLTDAYLGRTFVPEDSVLAEIRERSSREKLPEIQVGTMDALHLEVLTRMSGAKKAVEIGTLGGYSGTAILRGLGEGGKLYTFEYEPEHVKVASESFKKAGFAGSVEIFQGAALENLPKVKKYGPFDLVFCDADKENYPGYLRWAAENLRVGGVLIGDNTLGWGMIAQDRFEDPDDEKAVRGLQEFNRLASDPKGRFRATLLPTGEGLTVAVKIR